MMTLWFYSSLTIALLCVLCLLCTSESEIVIWFNHSKNQICCFSKLLGCYNTVVWLYILPVLMQCL